MSSPGRFADVDHSPDPGELAAYLDDLDGAPAVQAGKRRRDRLVTFLGAHVLDIGCGTGADVRAMGRLVGPRGMVVGVDASRELLAPGASATVTITVTPKARGVIINTASVGSSAPDPDRSNNTATAETTVGR